MAGGVEAKDGGSPVRGPPPPPPPPPPPAAPPPRVPKNSPCAPAQSPGGASGTGIRGLSGGPARARGGPGSPGFSCRMPGIPLTSPAEGIDSSSGFQLAPPPAVEPLGRTRQGDAGHATGRAGTP